MEKNFIFYLSVLLFTGCLQTKPEYLKMKQADGAYVFKGKKDVFRDYALCSCLHSFLKKDSIALKENSLETLYDLANDDLSIGYKGKILDSAALVFVNLQKDQLQTYEGRQTPFFDCILFARSKNLNKLIDSLLRADRIRRIE